MYLSLCAFAVAGCSRPAIIAVDLEIATNFCLTQLISRLLHSICPRSAQLLLSGLLFSVATRRRLQPSHLHAPATGKQHNARKEISPKLPARAFADTPQKQPGWLVSCQKLRQQRLHGPTSDKTTPSQQNFHTNRLRQLRCLLQLQLQLQQPQCHTNIHAEFLPVPGTSLARPRSQIRRTKQPDMSPPIADAFLLMQ